MWKIPQESNNPHPAPFPVEFAQRCIQSTDAALILDPFMGSGSTAIAAEVCERKWIGFESSKDYCQVARDRIAAHQVSELIDRDCAQASLWGSRCG